MSDLPDLLRRAAAEMKRRASEVPFFDEAVRDAAEADEPWPEHCATWTPTVAGYVADLLDEIADEYERARPCADGCPNQGEMTYSWWLAWSLAQAYLGEPGPPPPARRPEPGRVEAPTAEETG